MISDSHLLDLVGQIAVFLRKLISVVVVVTKIQLVSDVNHQLVQGSSSSY